MYRKSLLMSLFIMMLFTVISVNATAQKRYSGRKHTTSHGGSYSGGRGSSHKGGKYKNYSTSHRYGRHK